MSNFQLLTVFQSADLAVNCPSRMLTPYIRVHIIPGVGTLQKHSQYCSTQIGYPTPSICLFLQLILAVGTGQLGIPSLHSDCSGV